MLSARAAKALDPDIERRLTAYWPLHSDRAEARRLLSTYGEAEHEVEVVRVRLALLKLSAGSLDELGVMIDAAKVDYRDVLAWAECPEEMRGAWSSRVNPSETERRELNDVRARDRAQCEAWLSR
jgi:hypothetical protein